MGRPPIGKAERQRRRRDKLKGDPERRRADEILDFVGIDLACEVLEQCRRSDDDDDDEGGEPVCWFGVTTVSKLARSGGAADPRFFSNEAEVGCRFLVHEV